MRSEIFQIQREYLHLLQNSIKFFNEKSALHAIDNIAVFWYSHRRAIALFLNSLPQNFRTYLFTGASYLGTKRNNHYSFVSIGDAHIIDDPLCRLSAVPRKEDNQTVPKQLIDYMVDAAKDSIDIIQNYNSHILILPVTSGFHEEDEKIAEVSVKKFLHLFKEEFSSIEEYNSKLITIEDIHSALKDEWRDSLPMSDTSAIEDGLIKGFHDFKNAVPWLMGRNTSDSHLFFMHTNELLTQSIKILFSCAKFGIIPYIRSTTCFYYTFQIARSFLETPTIKNAVFRMTCAYILYKSLPEVFGSVEFDEYSNAAKNLDIVDSRLNILLSKYLETSELSFSEVQAELHTCFEHLAEKFKLTLN